MPEGVSGYGLREGRSASFGFMDFTVDRLSRVECFRRLLNFGESSVFGVFETARLWRVELRALIADQHELPETVRFTVFVTAGVILWWRTSTWLMNVTKLTRHPSDTNGNAEILLSRS